MLEDDRFYRKYKESKASGFIVPGDRVNRTNAVLNAVVKVSLIEKTRSEQTY